MFSRSKAPSAAPAKPEGERISGVPSIVSPDLKVTGNLMSRGDIQVDGHVEGDVEAANLTIGESGAVHGKVSAKTVRLCGSVHGEIHGGTVTLAASARMMGDIVHESLAIEAGAHLEGHCRRRDPEQAALSPATAVPATPAPAASVKAIAASKKTKTALEERSTEKGGPNGSGTAGGFEQITGSEPKRPG